MTRRPRILVVEDEVGIADTIRYALGADGFDPYRQIRAEPFDRTVDTHVKTLRQKLAAVAPDIDAIATHRGIGCSLRHDLPASPTSSPAASPAPPTPRAGTGRPPLGRRRGLGWR